MVGIVSKNNLANLLESSVLEKLLQVQDALHTNPDDESLFASLSGGLTEVPGIKAIGSCLSGNFFPGTFCRQHEPQGRLSKNCSLCSMADQRKIDGLPATCLGLEQKGAILIQLDTKAGCYGFLLIEVDDKAAFALYEPYVQSTANFLAIVLENRQLHEELDGVYEALEVAVSQRTQALAESEEKYAAVVKQASEGIYLLDPETKKILELNDSFKNMIGRPDISAQDLVVYDFVAHPEDEIDRIIQNVVSCGNYIVGERKYRHKNGDMIDVEASGKLIWFGGKKVLCVIVRNISERKRAERVRERLEERLRQAQKMEAIGTLAGGIAHDFNNILSAIIGYSELVKLSLPSASRAVKDIDEIVKSGMRAAGLVRQILDFSRKTDRSLQIVAPGPIVEDALRMLKATLPSTVTLEEYIDHDCGFVQVDPTGVHQIVLNLCTNAFHSLHDQKGAIRVCLFRKEGDHSRMGSLEGPAAVLTVSDTGCGMDKETMDRVFEPYFTTKAMGKGTGLGLAVVHGIVQDYKGRIMADSIEGNGSIFTVTVPLSARPAEEDKLVKQEQSSLQEPPMTARRVLFIDDEPALCSLCERFLRTEGYQVTVTTSSREALERIRREPGGFDLLITDQTMPDVTGMELVKEVLSLNPELPVIMCTGHSDIVSEEDAFANGVKRYLFKPFAIEELLRAVGEVFDGRITQARKQI